MNLKLILVKIIHFRKFQEEMCSRHQFSLVFLAVVMTICVIEVASILPSKYKKLDPGQNITGTIVGEVTAQTYIHCSIM